MERNDCKQYRNPDNGVYGKEGRCQLDPLFESSDLKATGTGIYQEVFDTVDYDGVAGADVVDTLLDGMESVGYTIG